MSDPVCCCKAETRSDSTLCAMTFARRAAMAIRVAVTCSAMRLYWLRTCQLIGPSRLGTTTNFVVLLIVPGVHRHSALGYCTTTEQGVVKRLGCVRPHPSSSHRNHSLRSVRTALAAEPDPTARRKRSTSVDTKQRGRDGHNRFAADGGGRGSQHGWPRAQDCGGPGQGSRAEDCKSGSFCKQFDEVSFVWLTIRAAGVCGQGCLI
eukprot:3935175-Rhodomonas_salina.2